jgi:cytochrome c oxidase cbb3-type subunit 1
MTHMSREGGGNAVEYTGVRPADGVEYDNDIVKKFLIASVVWVVVGLLVGVWLALEIAWWPANLGLPWTTLGGCARCTPTRSFAFAATSAFSASTTRRSGC